MPVTHTAILYAGPSISLSDFYLQTYICFLIILYNISVFLFYNVIV